MVAIIVAGVIFIPQAFVTNPWQLMVLRFILGLATAGLGPSVNTILKRITPDSLTGRVFGFNISALYLGAFGGSVLGGQVAAYLANGQIEEGLLQMNFNSSLVQQSHNPYQNTLSPHSLGKGWYCSILLLHREGRTSSFQAPSLQLSVRQQNISLI